MKKNIGIIFFSVLLNGYCMSQVHSKNTSQMYPDTDSLLYVINNSRDDSAKVNAYHMMGAVTAGTNAVLAIDYCKKGIALAKQISYLKGTIVCMLNASYCYGLLNNLPKALLYIDTTIVLYKKIGKSDRLAFCYSTRAEYKLKLGKLKQSLNDCDTAMLYSEKANSPTIKKYVYRIMGAIYYEQNDYDQSKNYYEQAYESYAQVGDSIPMADILNKLGNIYKHKKDYRQSIAHFEKAIGMAHRTQQENNLSEYYSNLSDVLLKTGDRKKAEAAAVKAVEYARQKNNKAQLTAAQKALSTVYLKNDSTDAAIKAASESYDVALDIDATGAKQLSANALAEAYFKKGDYKKAFDYMQLSKSLEDSIVKENYNKDIAAMQIKFKVGEKDRQIQLLAKDKELQKQKLKQQWLLMIAAGIVALLIFIAAWMLINRNRLKQRMKELELRNQIAADLHDEVGSSLSSIHMLSQMATHQGNEAAHKDILTRMSSNAKETMDKMGDIVWMIKPGETEAGSLKQRVERFAYEICSSKNIELSMQLEDLDKVKFSMEQRKNIYLIFKEALNNAVKYSGTEKIDIKASTQNKELILQVKDIGKGFDSSIVKKGNGLDNMKNRAKELQADLHIESTVENGTLLKLTVQV